MKNKIAIYAGTFAPITLGHLDIIQQAAQLFDKLIIAVSPYNRNDLPLTQPVRIDLINKSIKGLGKIEIVNLEGSLASLAKQLNAQWLVRGLRNAQDLAIEQSMAAMNKQLSPDLNTVFLQAKPEYQNIQATLVRQLMLCQEDISAFVPECVNDWYFL
jgi:pantetheine-phosphate adenylyltransferase